MVYHLLSSMYQPSSTVCLFILLTLLSSHYNGCSACLQSDRAALLELKASIKKSASALSFSSFHSWVDDETSNCCDWYRVGCVMDTDEVILLDLSQVAYHPSTTLNTSLLLSFKNLLFLDLSQNRVIGWLNNEGLERLSKLRSLRSLSLRGNMLNETTLASLNAITSLRSLYLEENHIAQFPRGICELEKLRKLDLHDNHIEGVLHPCISQNLTHLRYLDMSSNQLTGTIPLDLLSNMTSLEVISLSYNHFDENAYIMPLFRPQTQLKFLSLSMCNLNIPITHILKFLHNQYKLEDVDLSHNKIYGNYPNWLVENNTRLKSSNLENNSIDGYINFPTNCCKNIGSLDLSNNQIQGKLQSNFGGMFPNLKLLDLSTNYLNGRIPTSLSNMTKLETLCLSNNNFSEDIPSSFLNIFSLILSNNRLYGDLSPLLNITTLQYLDVNSNQFTVHFPTYSNFSINLITLDLSQNNISGRIPTWVTNLTNLESLKLGSNFFNGVFPSELCNLRKLQHLDISNNDLSGSIPSCLNLTFLRYLHLERNKFSGLLPMAILNSKDISTLDLNHNRFTGEIPKWLRFFSHLSLLLLKGNLLSGSIPQELCKLENIVILDLSSNNLAGQVPPCLGFLAFGKLGPIDNIYYYHMDGYTYSAFPKQEEVEFITKSRSDFYKGDVLRYMVGMDLSNNHFAGDIPSEFGALTGIRALNLSYNQLTGSIPKTLSNLKNLESMDLSHNNLSGEIPIELIGITTLEVFTVAYNNLFGRIPDMKAQFSTFNETSYQGNPFLCGPPLQSNCNSTNNDIPNLEETMKSEDFWNKYGINPVTFLASFITIYIVYFVAFMAVLYINPYWRRLWFDFINKCTTFIYFLF